MNPLNILHALVIWQSFLFTAVLFTPKYRKRRCNIYLALMLLTFGIHFSYNIFYTNNILAEVLPLYSCSYGFLYGPLLFLYTRFYLLKDITFKPIDGLHFLPFTFIVLATSLGYTACELLSIWVLPSIAVYCIFSCREILIYRKSFVQVSSKGGETHTSWIMTMLIVMICIVGLNMLQMRWPQFIMFGVLFNTELIVQLLVLVFINIIIYQALRSPQNFQQITASDIDIGRSQKTIQNTPADMSQLREMADKIETYMKETRSYLNPDLSLGLLSEMTDIHERTLSRAINSILKSNFSDYVNSYRITMIRTELEKSEASSISIKELMYEAGFNSRSVFNTLFKKVTGLTPTEYRTEHKKKRSDS